jgi:hypothetical protein
VRKKRNVILKKLKAVQKEIRKKSAYDLPRWIAQSRTTSQCCSFKLFMQAEESQRDGYRNKNTFTIGRDIAGTHTHPSSSISISDHRDLHAHAVGLQAVLALALRLAARRTIKRR